MRKTIAALVVSLGLVVGLSAAATADDPSAPSTNVQCQGATNQICDDLLAWAKLDKALEDKVAQQHATIVHQRAAIKRLRAKLSRVQ